MPRIMSAPTDEQDDIGREHSKLNPKTRRSAALSSDNLGKKRKIDSGPSGYGAFVDNSSRPSQTSGRSAKVPENVYSKRDIWTAGVPIQSINQSHAMPGRQELVRRQKWTTQEDWMLRDAVEKYGENNWNEVARALPNRSRIQCLQRWKKALRPGLIKGTWSSSEDKLLLNLVHGHLGKGFPIDDMDWKFVSTQIEGRNVKQCKERWFLNLDPSIRRGPWTPEEDERLLELAEELNRSWSQIAKEIPGRTENKVKIRYHSLMREKVRSRPWSEDEKVRLLNASFMCNFDWNRITQYLPGRTRTQAKKCFTQMAAQDPELSRKLKLAKSGEKGRGKRNTLINADAKLENIQMRPQPGFGLSQQSASDIYPGFSPGFGMPTTFDASMGHAPLGWGPMLVGRGEQYPQQSTRNPASASSPFLPRQLPFPHLVHAPNTSYLSAANRDVSSSINRERIISRVESEQASNLTRKQSSSNLQQSVGQHSTVYAPESYYPSSALQRSGLQLLNVNATKGSGEYTNPSSSENLIQKSGTISVEPIRKDEDSRTQYRSGPSSAQGTSDAQFDDQSKSISEAKPPLLHMSSSDLGAILEREK